MSTLEALHELRRLAYEERCERCGGPTYVAAGFWLTCGMQACLTPVRWVGDLYGQELSESAA